MLDEVTDIMTHFTDSLTAPINRIVDQILSSILQFFGGKDSALLSLLEKKVHEIIKNYTSEELKDLLSITYDLLKNTI